MALHGHQANADATVRLGVRLQGELGHALLPLPEELANRFDNCIAIVDFAGDQLIVVREVLPEVLDELPGPVGAVDLAVTEHISSWKQKLLEDVDAE